jgi:hypothetical protein
LKTGPLRVFADAFEDETDAARDLLQINFGRDGDAPLDLIVRLRG